MVRFAMIALAALLLAGLAGLAPATAAAHVDGHPPMPPTNIAAVDGANAGEVNLTWTAAADAVSYRIAWISNADFEADNRRGWLGRVRYGNVPATRTAYTVTGLTPGADYWFVVASIGADDRTPQWAPVWVRLQIRAMETAEPPPQGPPPPTMTMLADGVYHYFGFFSSSLVVIADDGVLITDTNNAIRAQSLKAEIAKITAAPVTQIVLTHEHYDHVGGTGVFPNAEIICHRNCQPHFDLDVLGDVPAAVDTTFDDMLSLDVGGKAVQLHYLGPGDGEATIIIYMPDEQIVVTSDLYEPRALTHKNWVHDKHFVGVRAILNAISQWPLTHAINAHSTGTNPVDLMENVAYYNALYDAVKTAIDEAIMQAGGQAFGAYDLYNTLPQTLELEQYRSWMDYDTSFPAHVERMLLGIYHGD